MVPLFILGATVVFSVAATNADLSIAEQTVNAFYNNLKILSAGEKDDASYEAGENCISMAASSEGQYFPNEFKKLGLTDSHNESGLMCKSYVSEFKRMASSHRMQFSYSIKKTMPYYETEWNKSDKQASFIHCIVEKRYGPSTYQGVIRDTVLLNDDRKIIGIRNFAGGEAYTEHHVQVSIPDQGQTLPTPVVDVNKVDINKLKFEASEYYTNRQYAKAYNTYKIILAHDESNANAYYRLAIMTYKRQGCSQYSKKQTDQFAMDYIKKAYDNGKPALKAKINNILYYW